MTQIALPTRTLSGVSRTDLEILTNDSVQIVEAPEEEDILCGKDKRCMTWKGSLFFKSVIDAHTVPYREAPGRNGKMAVTKKVFDMLQSKRFLKLNEETGLWEVLHPLSIRDKIGHALVSHPTDQRFCLFLSLS